MNRQVITRSVLYGLLIITAALDFFSFAIERKFAIFDMSPLTLLTNNLLIIFLVKFGVITGLIYLLTFQQKVSSYWRYLLVMMAVYLILFQTVGFINNRQVAKANPPLESAPSKEVRLKTGINFAMIWAYYPIFFSMLCFWLFNLGWED